LKTLMPGVPAASTKLATSEKFPPAGTATVLPIRVVAPSGVRISTS
jgi:hypothetical protein